jgi:hypothetical protein
MAWRRMELGITCCAARHSQGRPPWPEKQSANPIAEKNYGSRKEITESKNEKNKGKK